MGAVVAATAVTALAWPAAGQAVGSCSVTSADQVVTHPGPASTAVRLEIACSGNASAARTVTVKAVDHDLATLQAAANADANARAAVEATFTGSVTEVCIDDPQDPAPAVCVGV
jgi:hypothetical protein